MAPCRLPKPNVHIVCTLPTLCYTLPTLCPCSPPSDRTSSKNDFVFYTNRICRIVVEAGLGQLPFKEKVVVTPAGVGKGVGIGMGKGAGKGEGLGQLPFKQKVVVTPAGVGRGVGKARGRMLDAQRSVRVRGELVQLETVPLVPFSCPASIHQNPLVSHSVWGSHTRHRHQQDVSTTHKPAH